MGAFLPSDEWRAAGVHWHAFTESTWDGNRARLRERAPEAVLRSPWQVAEWLDEQTRRHVQHREVVAIAERVWVTVGDEDDLEHLRRENFRIASRGDSIHTDVYAASTRHVRYAEAVTDGQCAHGCTPHRPRHAGRRLSDGWRARRHSRAGQELQRLRQVRQPLLATASRCRVSRGGGTPAGTAGPRPAPRGTAPPG